MNDTKTIHIIDDDKVYQFTAKKALEKLSINKKVFIFSDGEEAYEFLSDNIGNEDKTPDYIFLDLNMPIMDGWDYLEEFSKIKTQLNKTPFIYIVSSSNDDIDTQRAKAIDEVAGYLVKPVHPKEFAKILNSL